MRFFIALMTAIVGSMNVGMASVSICSSSDAEVTDLQVFTNPENPVIGSDYNLTLSFTTTRDIVSGSKQKFKATFDGFPVTNESHDLCEELSKNDIMCPVIAGKQDMTWIANIPTDTPSGQIKGSQVWYNEDGSEIFCFSWTFNV